MAYHKAYVKTKRGHLSKYLDHAHRRAKRKEIPFDIDLDYLATIATDECPIFKTPFIWGRGQGLHNKDNVKERPSLDRIIPDLGYVKGNVVFISMHANSIKQTATEKELYAVADWLHEARKKVLNAQKNTAPSIPAEHSGKGEGLPEFGSIPRTWLGEDNNDTYSHCGADARKDASDRTQKSSGDSVGRRGEEMGTSETPQGVKDYGKFNTATHWPFYQSRRIPNKP